jgi:hypothetical protein
MFGSGNPRPDPNRYTVLWSFLVLALIGFVPAFGVAQTPASAESDPEREAWRIEVVPFAVLGSGHPGSRPSDITQPDGLKFTDSGLLLVTDAGNHRVQIWDVRTGDRLGEFGKGYLGGEVTNVEVTPDGTVFLADSVLNLVYVFAPAKSGAAAGTKAHDTSYSFQGTRFGDAGFRKLGGMAVDTRGRLYIADGKLWEVRRYTPDGKVDDTWKFERTLADGDTTLHRCEGMAIDEAHGLLYVASEADAVIKAFDLATGAFKRKLIGARPDRDGRATGKSVFWGSIEGLSTVPGHLLAVDEEAGHIRVFDLAGADLFDTDLGGYTTARSKGRTAYRGFFGRTARTNFDVDDSPNPDFELKRRVDAGEVNPGNVNAVGQFCSPDEIATYTDKAGGETYVAIADQCNFRIVVYRWSDIERALRAQGR